MNKDIIPKNKQDTEATELLSTYKKSLTSNESRALLEWMQDMHWDVSHPISDYFRIHINEISADLIWIFSEGESQWSWNIVRWLLMDNPNFIMKAELLVIIERIIDNPTSDEKDFDLDLICKELLRTRNDL